MSATLNEDLSFLNKKRTLQETHPEIVKMVNLLHLYNNCIKALIDQLYGINRRIMLESQSYSLFCLNLGQAPICSM